MIQKIKSQFRRNFIAGALVVGPVAIVAWVAKLLFGFLWNFAGTLHHQPDSFILQSAVFLFVVIILFIGISILGWASKQYLGQRVLQMIKALIEKIPVLGSVYGALDQLIKNLGGGSGKQFSRVVLIEFPRKGVWAIGFVSGPVKTKKLPKGLVNVFVPAVPNPTSGFHLMIAEDDVKETDLTVEEALRMILSLGFVQGN